MCNEYNVLFDRCKIENLLKYFKILQDDKYNIEKFVNILNKSVEFPYLPVMPGIEPFFIHKTFSKIMHIFKKFFLNPY